MVKSGCIPSDVCQNDLAGVGYETSTQYVCNSDGSKSFLSYEGLDCTSSKYTVISTYDANDTSINSYYDDVKCDGSCKQYIKYKEYTVTDTKDSTCSTKYGYITYVISPGCGNFGSGTPDIFTIWSCTDNTLTKTTYPNGTGDCSGNGVTITYKNGCDNSLGYGIYREIEYCQGNIDSGIDRVHVSIIIPVIFSCLICFHIFF